MIVLPAELWGASPLAEGLEPCGACRAFMPAGHPHEQEKLAPNARRLTDDQVRAIRASTESTLKLSLRYDVNRDTIKKIREGKRYKDVE